MELRLFQPMVDEAADACGAAVVELHALPDLVGAARLPFGHELPPFLPAAIGGALFGKRRGKPQQEGLRKLQSLFDAGHLPEAPAQQELRVLPCPEQVAAELGAPAAFCADV